MHIQFYGCVHNPIRILSWLISLISETVMFESGSRYQPDGNERWTLRAALAAGEDSAVARVVIDKAKAGDAVAARFVLGLLYPRPRGRTITLALPAAPHAGDVSAAFAATLAPPARRHITPDQALTRT